jgi:hypothetical protein
VKLFSGEGVIDQAISAVQIIVDRLQLRGGFDRLARDDLRRADSCAAKAALAGMARATAQMMLCNFIFIAISLENMHGSKARLMEWPLDERSGITVE